MVCCEARFRDGRDEQLFSIPKHPSLSSETPSLHWQAKLRNAWGGSTKAFLQWGDVSGPHDMSSHKALSSRKAQSKMRT